MDENRSEKEAMNCKENNLNYKKMLLERVEGINDNSTSKYIYFTVDAYLKSRGI